MRKYHQKKIFESLQTLKEAHDEIKTLLQRRAFSSFTQLVDDCKGFILSIKGFIDDLRGEGTKTAALLMDYYKALSEIQPEISKISNLMKYLQRQLIKIENSVVSELKPDRMEIVFFSYKASMWDSLESIYFAAKADPQCDAYVVSIPYYDKLPDGQFGQMHYECDEYPDNIPIVAWQDYDVESRMPDVIFIHNPYDDDNYVTSVHPDFYSKRLKEFTDLLVYIPYFVLANEVPAHFAICNGPVYADCVIVQSEGIREQYIRIFKEFEKSRGHNKNQFGKPEEKFVALGSPKFDKAIITKREDCIIPDEWLNLIKRMDGTSKKVVLYNTSVNAVLNSEDYLKKLCAVLKTFRERDDVVLWWRPHPLIESTFDSMRPQLREEYNRIVLDYKRDKWGVYDETADLHRAIAMSDAMYGDFSSVGVLYSVTGKPVLATNYEIDCLTEESVRQEYLHADIINFGLQVLTIEEFERLYPAFYEYWLPYRNAGQSRFVQVPCYEYGLSSFLNAIYKVDEENGNAEYFMCFPGEENTPFLYHSPVRLGNKLIFIPICARQWAFYDMDFDTWFYTPLPEELYTSEEWRAAFGGSVLYGEDLIFLPGESGAFAKYNIETGKITYHREWFSHIRRDIVDVDWGIITGVLCYQDSLLLISSQTNKIFDFNPRTMSVNKVYKVCHDSYKFKMGFLVPNTDTVYLIKFREPGYEPWTETIVKWNIKSGETVEFTDLPINFVERHTANALNSFVFWKGVLYAMPLQGDAILKIDLQTDDITKYTLMSEFDFFKRKSKYYEGWAKDQALPYVIFNGKRMKYMAQLPYDYGVMDIDFENGQVSNRRKWHVNGVVDLYKEKGLNNRNPKLPFFESYFTTLVDFLDQMESDDLMFASKEQLSICCESPSHADGMAGKAIYDYVKQIWGA